MENKQEKSQEEMVKEAVEEARKAAEETAEEETAQETAEEAAEETAEETAQETSEEASEEAADSEKAEEGSEEKKKFFGKKKKDKKDEKIEELTDKLTRQMAEFDNFRKRTEKEKSQMYEVGAKDIRGLAAVTEEEKENAFVQGMEKVYKQLMTTLEGIEVKPIEAVGKEFDPNFHNAVMHVEDENLGENIVAEEFQKGYLYRDSVVRHSMVKVAN